MVFCEPIDHARVAVAERDQPRRREDPDLAHPAAEQLARPARLPDERLRPDEHAPDGTGEALREAERHQSAGPASSRGSSSRATTVFQKRAPSMWSGTPRSWATAARSRTYADGTRLVVGVGGGVLEHHQAGDRLVDVHRVAEALAHAVEVERPVGVLEDGVDGAADDDGVARRLVQHDVAVDAGDRLLAPLEVGHLGHEVAHRARGDEQAGLLAEQLRRALLERDHRRVVAEDVVADLRLGHRATHLGRGLRDGVGPQVDEGHRPGRIARTVRGS